MTLRGLIRIERMLDQLEPPSRPDLNDVTVVWPTVGDAIAPSSTGALALTWPTVGDTLPGA